ncbi:Oidioi.mRNA.OKI2018_I69.PAR.g11885.t1.cds [Oikopleura dioica]|uniref:Mediator of RNA polymerase II transcription subunit 20 n=1 Tax=Oikopleura dioica TaxID=34765 RepID=A0ABN7S234_OIKDI|nr:Oidioi.mRNA.OKI2018_I69.PAR.g11885.t1.cds [Oikopleura dioica]
MGVTVVFQWELVDGQTHQQAIQELHGRINNTGAVQEGKFYYESKFYQASDSSTTRGKTFSKDFYTLKTSEYPVTVFARVDDSTKDKNSCIQCDSPMESLLIKLREFFTPKRTFEIRGTRFKLADFWIRPGIVTSSGSNKCVTVEIEYTPSYFADDCWPLFSELGSYILNRPIDEKPPT